ncbi:TetR family transcriptional regulator [Nocardia donostiensis]|uniref:HTH tetR-type domain-containing protein n=1 Tax=Nocardia donostiensis TaxID=1538463 RepID=A0A1W0B7E2_9NOCA|nr:TetR family transcriptional regulator [Nocardia donostiensis]ONM46230.1 hypothetical protein B0T46_23890 [Nocardia donostiensis]OQS13345.1 hypothetical protein B0T36_19705 [Nocardia donostiensis]OQS18445.1 hypothetical protein B0T44_19800 [Nocardia donostiensis]
MPPIGRRPGTPNTRELLVETARHRFAATGYDKTTVRRIAADAGVDPALIRHYFGSKAGLFRATMGWPFEPAELAARVVQGDRSGVGERLTQTFFEAWDRTDSRAPLLAILRGAATDEETAELVREFIQEQVYAQIATELPEPDAQLRVDLAMAQLLGIAYLRYILRVEPIASADLGELTSRIAPIVNAHLGTTIDPASNQHE